MSRAQGQRAVVIAVNGNARTPSQPGQKELLRCKNSVCGMWHFGVNFCPFLSTTIEQDDI
jgi:hypothetical protein